MIKRMKRICLLTMMLVLILIGSVQAMPIPEDDKGYMIDHVFNHEYITYSYSNLSIGGSATGVTGGQYSSNATENMIYKTAVFELKVENEGMVILDVMPINGKYHVSSNINVYFISSASGQKKYYNPAVSSTLEVGNGNCKRAFYAYPGKYFISVGGNNYSQKGLVTNHRIFLNFSIKATQETYKTEYNGDTTESKPCNLSFTDSVVINGNLGMKTMWGTKWYVDSKDRYTFIAPKTGKINLTLSSKDSNALRLFTKKQKISNGIKNLTNEWKDYARVVGSIADPGNIGLCRLEVYPGSSNTAVVDVKAGKVYKLNLSNRFPCEYKAVLSYGDGSKVPVATPYSVSGYKMVQHKEYKGSLSQEQQGVKMIGDMHTNGRLVNGYRDGNRIDTVQLFDVKNKTVYGAFTVYGTSYSGYTGLAVENVTGGSYVTTHHSWAGSKVVQNGTKIYKTLTFTNSTWKMTIATGNYYGKAGSTLIQEKSGTLSEAAKKAINKPQKILFCFGDNYSGASNYMIVNELIIGENTVDHNTTN